MTLIEYITYLSAQARRHGGDVPVVDSDDKPPSEAELIDGYLVLADKF
jgi:hypothetical protein